MGQNATNELHAFPLDRLTLGYLTLSTDPISTVEAAGKAGFRSVSIRITGRRLADPYVEIVGQGAAIAAVRRRLDEYGLRLSNIAAYHFYSDVESVHLDAALDTAAALGTGTVIANSYLTDQSRFFDLFCAYCEMAEKRGLRIALEFMPYSQVKSLAAAADIVSRVGSANVGLVIDPLHLERAGESPADLRGVEPDRIFLVQLCDAELRPGATQDELRDEARTARLYPGLGKLPLRELLDAVPSESEIEIETPRPELRHLDPAEQARRALQASRTFLNEWAAMPSHRRRPTSTTTER
jgi:sugar phosphate isomerase/epimerase